MMTSIHLPKALQVLDFGVIFSKWVFSCGNYFVDVVDFGALFGPVAMAELLAVLGETGQHDHDHAALLPHHLPEVRSRVRKGTGGGNVRRVTRIVVSLNKTNTLCEFESIICGTFT